ncbi:unnamed protein product [Miscanthus lutarioriparius]|uniref:DUF7913 domain-containing protein n=1 Tax=Miscanthus lutarioriparius TaxID=422564 RepID=A0A811NTW9_9POAL|nr:unnamed protein product [Miscanthus lutarioriparius]
MDELGIEQVGLGIPTTGMFSGRRKVHATVLLYNYYHQKQFPQLEFASPDRFCMSASLTVSNKNLLMYLNQAQNLGN